MKKRFLAISLSLILTSAALTGCGTEFELTKKEITVELGTKLSDKVSDYVTSSDESFDDVSIDTSGIDFAKVGTYDAKVLVKDKEKFTVKILIEDTTAPEVKTSTTEVAIEVGTKVTPDMVITETKDLGGEVALTLAEDKVYEEPGTFTNQVIATDPSGNKTTTDFTIQAAVYNPPVLTGLEDITMGLGSELSNEVLLDGVAATDELDGDITANVTVDTAQVDANTAGEYTATYKVVNSKGKEAVGTVKVVVSKEKKKTAAPTKANTSTDKKEDGTKQTDKSSSYDGNKASGGSSGSSNGNGNTSKPESNNTNNSNSNASNGSENNNPAPTPEPSNPAPKPEPPAPKPETPAPKPTPPVNDKPTPDGPPGGWGTSQEEAEDSLNGGTPPDLSEW